MIEVQVENFQSITKAHFKIDGFTALVGRSNIGKSALVRAFRNALTGASGTDFVRHGPSCERRLRDNKKCKCQTTVRIVTTKLEIVWEKGDAINRYTVTRQGEPPVLYDKVDRGTPDFLCPDFAPVKIGDDLELIQVSEQFAPIFLLNASGSAVADVLSDVAKLDDINDATRLVVKDKKDASATRTVRERDVADLAKEIEAYDGLDLTAEDVRRIEVRHVDLQAQQQKLDDVGRLCRRLEGIARAIRGLQEVMKHEVPDPAPMQKTSEKLAQVVRFSRAWAERSVEVEKLSGIETIGDLPTPETLQATHEKFALIGGWYRRLQALKVDYERLSGIGKVKDPPHEGLLAKFDRLRTIEGLSTRYEMLTKSIASVEDQLAKAEQEAASVLEELKALGMCPTCSQPVASDQHLHLVEAP